jgi:2-C-methyl-D-erythritol 4-phosphate cytidylyltransferase
MRKAVGLAALSVVVATLSACGGSVSVGDVDTVAGGSVSVGVGPKVFDRAELEQELAKQLAPQGGMTTDDITVSCPDDVPVEKGHRFDCKLTVKDDRSTVVVKVTQTNDSGHVSATVPEQTATTAS